MVIFLFTLSCQQSPPPPTYAFYHWQTNLAVDTALLAEFDTDRLYIKAFDISYNDGHPEPTALLSTPDTLPKIQAIPVIFITNEVFTHDNPDLTQNLLSLLAEVFPYPHTELQIDCDWTAGTRVQYFSFLQQLAESSGKQISCTVRLHQYRDRELQGVPPADRGVLMAYNTGDLRSWETENSIVDSAVIAGYVEDQPPYPLPLDLAVAVYDWATVYRRGALAYLINEPNFVELSDTDRFSSLSPGRYRVDSSTYFAGLYLYQNDRIRLEAATKVSALQLADRLWPQIAGPEGRHVIFYRMGSRQWSR